MGTTKLTEWIADELKLIEKWPVHTDTPSQPNPENGTSSPDGRCGDCPQKETAGHGTKRCQGYGSHGDEYRLPRSILRSLSRYVQRIHRDLRGGLVGMDEAVTNAQPHNDGAASINFCEEFGFRIDSVDPDDHKKLVCTYAPSASSHDPRTVVVYQTREVWQEADEFGRPRRANIAHWGCAAMPGDVAQFAWPSALSYAMSPTLVLAEYDPSTQKTTLTFDCDVSGAKTNASWDAHTGDYVVKLWRHAGAPEFWPPIVDPVWQRCKHCVRDYSGSRAKMGFTTGVATDAAGKVWECAKKSWTTHTLSQTDGSVAYEWHRPSGLGKFSAVCWQPNECDAFEAIPGDAANPVEAEAAYQAAARDAAYKSWKYSTLQQAVDYWTEVLAAAQLADPQVPEDIAAAQAGLDAAEQEQEDNAVAYEQDAVAAEAALTAARAVLAGADASGVFTLRRTFARWLKQLFSASDTVYYNIPGVSYSYGAITRLGNPSIRSLVGTLAVKSPLGYFGPQPYLDQPVVGDYEHTLDGEGKVVYPTDDIGNEYLRVRHGFEWDFQSKYTDEDKAGVDYAVTATWPDEGFAARRADGWTTRVSQLVPGTNVGNDEDPTMSVRNGDMHAGYSVERDTGTSGGRGFQLYSRNLAPEARIIPSVYPLSFDTEQSGRWGKFISYSEPDTVCGQETYGLIELFPLVTTGKTPVQLFTRTVDLIEKFSEGIYAVHLAHTPHNYTYASMGSNVTHTWYAGGGPGFHPTEWATDMTFESGDPNCGSGSGVRPCDAVQFWFVEQADACFAVRAVVPFGGDTDTNWRHNMSGDPPCPWLYSTQEKYLAVAAKRDWFTFHDETGFIARAMGGDLDEGETWVPPEGQREVTFSACKAVFIPSGSVAVSWCPYGENTWTPTTHFFTEHGTGRIHLLEDAFVDLPERVCWKVLV